MKCFYTQGNTQSKELERFQQKIILSAMKLHQKRIYDVNFIIQKDNY